MEDSNDAPNPRPASVAGEFPSPPRQRMLRTDPAGKPLRDRFRYVEVSLRSRSPGPAVYTPSIDRTGSRGWGQSGIKAGFHGSTKTILQEFQTDMRRGHSPGPKYTPQQLTPAGARGYGHDGAKYTFGSRTKFGSSMERPKFEQPGPGTYPVTQLALGPQHVSRRGLGQTAPNMTFGQAERKTIEVPPSFQPGPGRYDEYGRSIQLDVGRSFGSAKILAGGPRDQRFPGPGTYPARSQIGAQPESIKESAPSTTFSKAVRISKKPKIIGAGCGCDPHYEVETSSIGMQYLSKRRTGPSFSF